MAKITSEDSSRRLAEAIVSDIVLYNDEEIRAGGDISGSIAEGRKLFESRVSPEYHSLLEAELQSRLGQLAPSARVSGTQLRAGGGLPPGMFEDQPRPKRSSSALPVLLLLIIAGVGAAGWWFAQSGQ
jgi:hypothetical protein